MSFELKPQTPITGIGRYSKVDKILWTLPRDTLPPLLQGRVPLSVWTKTWDAVYTCYEKLFAMVRPYKFFIFIPCAAPCVMAKMAVDNRKFWDMWTTLSKEQQTIYLQYNVQVTVAKEVRGYGSGHFRPEPVGLRFDIGFVVPAYQNHTNVSPFDTMSPAYNGARVAPFTDKKEDDIITKLERLDQLHKTGALSDEEYREAKAKLF